MSAIVGNDDEVTTRRRQRELWRFHLSGIRPGGLDAGREPLIPCLLPALRDEAGNRVSGEALIALYLHHLESHRAPLRASFVQRVEKLERGLEELLQVDRDRSGAAADAGALSGSLGAGGSFLDLDRLSGQLKRRPGFGPLDDERRRRVEEVLPVLKAVRQREHRRPRAVVLHAAGEEAPPQATGVETLEHEDPCREALEQYVRRAAELLPTFRAVQLARLLIGGTFEPELHGPLLERLDGRSFAADEPQLLPQLVVLESAARLRGPLLGSLSELLRSGYPIHVLVADRFGSAARNERRTELSGNHVSLGALAMAHREAFVLQSSTGAPERLAGGLAALVASACPALAVIAVADPQLPAAAGDQLAAMRYGRATPGFRYDPAGGEALSDRLVLDGNPQPDTIWPAIEVQARTERFTFAHLSAMVPACRAHFAVIPPDAWDATQVEIATYLDTPGQERRRSLPFVWVESEDGQPARAIVTRELAFATLGRAHAWRVLQELSGTDNACARRAAEEARQAAEAASESKIAALRAEHEEALQRAGETAVQQAMQRVTASLLDVDVPPDGRP